MNLDEFWRKFSDSEADYSNLHRMTDHSLAQEIESRFSTLNPFDEKDRLLLVLAERLATSTAFPPLPNRTLDNLLNERRVAVQQEVARYQETMRDLARGSF